MLSRAWALVSDGPNVKCCQVVMCTKSSGNTWGFCKDTEYKCDTGYISGRCPGGSGVKCCLQDNIQVVFKGQLIPLD